MNDLLRIDMGSKPPTIKFQALSGNSAERRFYRSLDPQMGAIHSGELGKIQANQMSEAIRPQRPSRR